MDWQRRSGKQGFCTGDGTLSRPGRRTILPVHKARPDRASRQRDSQPRALHSADHRHGGVRTASHSRSMTAGVQTQAIG